MIPALAFAVGVIVTTEFIVIGLLPLLADDLAEPLHRVGWLVSLFAMAAAVPGPALTLLAARWPARRVLSTSLLVFGAANLAAALMPGFAVLMAARLVQGALLTVIISVASTTAAALAVPGRGGRAIGQVNLGTVLATLLAMPAGAALAERFGWQPVFIGLGIAAMVAAVAVGLSMPPVATGGIRLRQQAGILKRSRFLAHLLLSGLLFAAMFSAYSYIAAFITQVLAMPEAALGPMLFGFGLAGVVGNWVAMRAVDRNPVQVTSVVAGVLVAALGALMAWHTIPGAALLLLPVWGMAHMAAFVACQVRVVFAAPEAPAFAASLNIAVCNLGIAAGAAVGGWLVAQYGVALAGLGTVAAGLPALALSLGLQRRGSVPASLPS